MKWKVGRYWAVYDLETAQEAKAIWEGEGTTYLPRPRSLALSLSHKGELIVV